MHTHPRPPAPDTHYDAIVIGSGIGGLFTANYLARRGRSVLVCEKHRTPGGYICGFHRGPYYFDGANNSFSSHGTIFGLLDELGVADRVDFRLHEMTHRVRDIGMDFSYSSIDDVCSAFERTFAAEPRIHDFVSVIRDFYDFFSVIEENPNPMLFRGLAKARSALGYAGTLVHPATRRQMWSVLRYGLKPSGAFVREFFPAGSEAERFFRNYGNPNQQAVVLGAMLSEFIRDKWYPVGGEQHFADVLAELAEEHGARIAYRTEVLRIRTRAGVAVGVDATGGRSFTAGVVVTDADYKKTFTELLDDQGLLPERFARRLHRAETSESLFTIYLGLAVPQDEVRAKLGGGNRLNYSRTIVPKDTLALADDPAFFDDITLSIFSPSLASPGLTEPGRTALTIQCLCPAHWMDDWGRGDPQRYEELKTRARDTVLALFDEAVPGVLTRAEHTELATPKTYERYTGNTNGAYCAWSWEKGKSFFEDLRIHTETPVRGLYCCSDWSYKIGGMVSSMLAGRIVANEKIR